MTKHSGCLPDSLLTAIASDQMDAKELAACEEHLEHCPMCCERLEAQAAAQQSWEAAREYLPDDDSDLEFNAHTQRTHKQTGSEIQELLRILKPTDDPQWVGELGGYRVADVVGAGGMGIVLKAYEPALSRFVALKVLSPRLWYDDQARQRFAREARAAGSVVHENVMEIHAVSEVDGIPLIAMPYVTGDTLQKRIDDGDSFSVEETLRIGSQIAHGLAAAHARGLVHRDVKPSNILLENGRVRITDFGIAHVEEESRLTQSGVVAGTPQYMSPEQIKGEPIDARSDLFSLGSVLYVLCTGRPPFEAESRYELLNRVVEAKPPRAEKLNPKTPTWLAAIIAKLHARRPDDRYQSASETAAVLDECLHWVRQSKNDTQPLTVKQLDARYRRGHSRRLFFGGMLMLGTLLAETWLLSSLLTYTPVTAIDVKGRVVDEQGAPVANTTILAAQKTWPNNRYRQQMLQTTTDADGRFVFEGFAAPGEQYAFLLTVVSDQWLMTHEYQLVKDGRQVDPVVLRTAKAEPVTIRVKDESGKPLANVRVLPSQRVTGDTEYILYQQQLYFTGAHTNDKGEVAFASWKPSEKGAIVYRIGDEVREEKFTVPTNRVIDVTVTSPPEKSIHVDGQVVGTDGTPVANEPVYAIQKTWPNNRYRQDALSTKTDANGHFRFEKFAVPGKQYAFLVTVMKDGFAMVSEYRIVEDGKQLEPVTLKLEEAEPITFVIQDAAGKPVQGVQLAPNQRDVGKEVRYLNYWMHLESTSKTTNAKGEVTFTAWQPGESGLLHYKHADQAGELKFEVGDDRIVTLKLPSK